MTKTSNKLQAKQKKILDDVICRYPVLASIENAIKDAYFLLKETYDNSGKLLIAGNGGSAADAEHIVGELMKKFMIDRPIPKEFAAKIVELDSENGRILADALQCSLPAIALTNHTALSTAILNDTNAEMTFAQQLYGYGKSEDAFIGISTSGNSQNVVYAALTAKAVGMKVIALTGSGGGKLAEIADISVQVPESETYKVQELHLPVYHCWCNMLEDYFFRKAARQ